MEKQNSEKYLQKIANIYITDLTDNPESFPNIKKIKHYGEYCRLQAIMDRGKTKEERLKAKILLDQMAKEDELK